jgi:two-component system, chemotaxis family, protein-glutamate methylesterase/glutaminase
MSIAAAHLSTNAALGHDSIRVMVVDDSALVCGLLTRWIEAEAGLAVVAAPRSGREAIEQLERADPDVVILDVDMPDMDGITALPHLMAKRRDLVVIMASTLTRRNAEISMRALALGAADYIPKPEAAGEITTSSSFHRELIEKIRALGSRRKWRSTQTRAPHPAAAVSPARADLRHVASPEIAPASEHAVVKLRPFPVTMPRVVLVGSSTGGPQALNSFIARLNGVIDAAPVLIVQHLPPTFTTILAEHLARASGRVTREAVAGEPVLAGQIYIAPGGRHMRVVRRDGTPSVALDDGPPVNFCKPAVDHLFSSAAEVWGPRSLAVVLTGMGSDGARGAADIVAAGGSVIAQDEATSVVWGMPGSVAHAGLCSAVLPLDQIAPRIVRLMCGGRP